MHTSDVAALFAAPGDEDQGSTDSEGGGDKLDVDGFGSRGGSPVDDGDEVSMLVRFFCQWMHSIHTNPVGCDPTNDSDWMTCCFALPSNIPTCCLPLSTTMHPTLSCSSHPPNQTKNGGHSTWKASYSKENSC